MKQTIYQVDAFADTAFSGNPAAVCILDSWLADSTMQAIAMENNLSETAFLVKNDVGYDIRWFTPGIEVDLCGHATLASAFVIFEKIDRDADTISFFSPRSGDLAVSKTPDGRLELDFPKDTVREIASIPELDAAIGLKPLQTYKGKTDIMLVYENQDQIEGIRPNFKELANLDVRGVIVTAPGKDVDFVSRFFAPQSGVDEDPVTGSAHTTMIPYWAKRLKKNNLKARQLSSRGGTLFCKLSGDRVRIAGNAVLYLEGTIFIP